MKLPKIFPVTCHTDNIGPGSTFVALKGMKEDGINYIPLAIKKGAKKIVVGQDAKLNQAIITLIKKQNIELFRSENIRQTLAKLSAQAFNFPAKKLKIIGVTGTKGKTTTCFLLDDLLQAAGYKTALLSTVHNKIENTFFKTNLTTQHPDYLQVFFDLCVKNNVEFVVMEVAAQALTLDRVYGIEFDGIIFTNFDLEHAEFYNSMDAYFAAKCKIFTQAKPGTPLLINEDNEWCKKVLNYLKNDSSILRQAQDERSESCARPFVLSLSKDYAFAEASSHRQDERSGITCFKNRFPVILSEIKNRVELFSFSLKNIQANFYAQILKNDVFGLNIKINNEHFICPALFGEFNAYNILSAVALLKQLGIVPKKMIQGLKEFKGVPGRLQMYKLPNGAQACIDKAHNPSSYYAILGTLRAMTDHLIVVFGCGGERDKGKRPIMGKIATELADLVILTNDDPRSEDPVAIIEDIFVGIDERYYNKTFKQIDREQAIKLAYKHSRPTSIITLLGKGPEEYQLIDDVKYPFSEPKVLRNL